MKNHFKKILIASIVIAGSATPLFAFAVNLLPSCIARGDCGINDIVQTLINFARLLLGLVGSFVLVYFVYGGFVWLTSHGDSNKIKKGMEIVRNAVIGLIIAFGAFTIVQLIYNAMGVSQELQFGQECSTSGGIGGQRGIVVPILREGRLTSECVTSCSASELAPGGYSCKDPATGTNCIFGLQDCEGSQTACCQ